MNLPVSTPSNIVADTSRHGRGQIPPAAFRPSRWRSLLLDSIYFVFALVAGPPYLIYRRCTRGRSSATLAEYLGRVSPRPVGSRCIWIHGVSLGEINATRTIVDELHRRAPETVVVISSTTQTGLSRARELYPKHVVF